MKKVLPLESPGSNYMIDLELLYHSDTSLEPKKQFIQSLFISYFHETSSEPKHAVY